MTDADSPARLPLVVLEHTSLLRRREVSSVDIASTISASFATDWDRKRAAGVAERAAARQASIDALKWVFSECERQRIKILPIMRDAVEHEDDDALRKTAIEAIEEQHRLVRRELEALVHEQRKPRSERRERSRAKRRAIEAGEMPGVVMAPRAVEPPRASSAPAKAKSWRPKGHYSWLVLQQVYARKYPGERLAPTAHLLLSSRLAPPVRPPFDAADAAAPVDGRDEDDAEDVRAALQGLDL